MTPTSFVVCIYIDLHQNVYMGHDAVQHKYCGYANCRGLIHYTLWATHHVGKTFATFRQFWEHD